MFRQASGFRKGINTYVPAMQYASGVEYNAAMEAFLGSPAGLDADGIHADFDGDGAANLTLYAADVVPGTSGIGATSDAVFGQNFYMLVSADPGAGGVIMDLYGEDYLGQLFVERLTTLSGATAAVEGVKAAKRFIKAVLIDPATNAIVVDLGWGSKYGLPYKAAEVQRFREGTLDGVPGQIVNGDPVSEQFGAGAGTGTHPAPVDGYIIGWQYSMTTAQATAAATLDAVVNGTGQATLDIVTPAVVAVGGSASKYLPRSGWLPILKGQNTVFTSDNGGDTGVGDVTLIYATGDGGVFVQPVLTDPQTNVTGDPRGLYDPTLAPNGTREYWVWFWPDVSVNAANNGGLHGIRHVAS